MDKMVTFRDSQVTGMSIGSHFLFVHHKLNVILLLQLGNGDIICFQRSPEDESIGQCGHPNVCSFLEYVHHHQVLNEPFNFFWDFYGTSGVIAIFVSLLLCFDCIVRTQVYFTVVTLYIPWVLKF